MTHRDDKAAVIAKARKIIAGPYLVLDTETTGLSEASEIVDIGIVDHDGKALLNSLVKPLNPIPADASAIHGITDAMVAQAPSWAAQWPEIASILSGARLGIYNEEFDVRMMRISSLLHAIAWQPPYLESFCIMKMFSAYYGDWSDYFGDYRWQKLEFAGHALGIELENTHRALDDAQLSREVLLRLAQGKRSN